jgi:hypothetical protein
MTETVVDCEALPPAPVQLNVYVLLAVSAPVVALPCTASLPDHPPDAVQEDAFVADHVNVDALPLSMVLGLAVIVTVGAGVLTDTVADCEALPPVPVQVRTKFVVAVSVPVDCEPLTGFEPLQPPLARQDDALDADQVNVAAPPAVIALGPTLKLTIGAVADTVTVVDSVALPPGPMHVRV